ncbi:anhydro-N-acetylmuramic acid kinase [Actinokineospora sp. HUAS TT18]|uniref:anhydro-N-acetylmuramic acid kinase n=1 Tax=Actinokineospora sp. HUAS TT18 TaxID=3447451 RepID=UPI003F51B246
MGRSRVVGVISGTSMDGVDIAVADLTLDGDTVDLVPLSHHSVPYPDDLRADLLAALPPGDCTAERLCRLDTGVGQTFGAAAAAAGPADLVASLGQTLFHWVDGGTCRGTLQLGQPAWIAEATGLPVVSDLRARDVAGGGHGAPLAGILDRMLMPDGTAALNLGGIANVTIDGVAFDTGPGNALLDAAARDRLGTDQDTDGATAAQGTVRPDLLAILLADPYYAAPKPKSTGKEQFNGDYLAAALARVPRVADADLLATLVALTAQTVADACRGVTRVLASGGGARNPALMAALAADLAPATLGTTEDLGLPVDGKEAYLAAVLGFLTWHGVPVDPRTGGNGPRVLGSITPGRASLSLPEPHTGPVRRLRVLPDPDAAGGTCAGP